jgi:hypothetical protein
VLEYWSDGKRGNKSILYFSQHSRPPIPLLISSPFQIRFFDFRIFSRGIVSRRSLAKTEVLPYRTATGPTSQFHSALPLVGIQDVAKAVTHQVKAHDDD